jgi:hypothetical protein
MVVVQPIEARPSMPAAIARTAATKTRTADLR